MAYTYIFIAAAILAAVVMALIGFYYAARQGQLRSVKDGSMVIFDAEEPVGLPTDAFPGAEPGSVRPRTSGR